MSQYAFGLNLARRLKTNLFFHIQEANRPSSKQYFSSSDFLLDKFNTSSLNFASIEQINSIIKIPLWQRAINRLKPFYKRHFVCEKNQDFDANYLNATDNTYFEGFWISEGYFQTIRLRLFSEFQLLAPLEGKNLACKDLMKATNSVAVHIRRGDFVSNEQINKIHGTIGLAYYKKAIGYIRSRETNPKFFFFSDDAKWVEENIPMKDVIYIDWNGTQKPECDLMLMTYAKHNIIANSTFSWWGAWLNRNDDKIVVAPKKWYASESKEKQAGGIVPSNWIRM